MNQNLSRRSKILNSFATLRYLIASKCLLLSDLQKHKKKQETVVFSDMNLVHLLNSFLEGTRVKPKFFE